MSWIDRLCHDANFTHKLNRQIAMQKRQIKILQQQVREQDATIVRLQKNTSEIISDATKAIEDLKFWIEFYRGKS